MIDHYVMLFRGTPVMLSDMCRHRHGSQRRRKGYSAPIELSVLRAAAAAVLFCVSVCLMQRSFKVHKRWYCAAQTVFAAIVVLVAGVHRRTPGIGSTVGTGTGVLGSPAASTARFFYFLRCATELVCASSRRVTARIRLSDAAERIYRQTGHENARI